VDRVVFNCADCIHRAGGVFSNIAPDLHRELADARRIHTYRPGQCLFYEGTPAHDVFCLLEGQVRLYRAGHDGKEHLLRLLGPADMVGHRPILADEPYSASAEAVTTTTACILPGAVLRAVIRRSPDLAEAFLARLSRELRISEDQRVLLSQGPLRRRVARLLSETLSRVLPPWIGKG
jgi:CRP/FNR family transcriptional regulator